MLERNSALTFPPIVMAQLSARRAALAALRTWRTEKQFADSVISKVIGETVFAASDRAFALELFYGVLRNLTLLDFWIGCLRTSHVNVELRDILRLGFYQLFILSTPEHAAVYETVELAPKRGRPPHQKALSARASRHSMIEAAHWRRPVSKHAHLAVESAIVIRLVRGNCAAEMESCFRPRTATILPFRF